MAYSNKVAGLNLMYQRKKAGLTQEQLAAKSGVSKDSIIRYELGSTVPGLDKAYELAAAIGCSINDIAGLAPAAGDAA